MNVHSDPEGRFNAVRGVSQCTLDTARLFTRNIYLIRKYLHQLATKRYIRW